MKKSLLLGITLALAVGASTGALLANKPISKSAKAEADPLLVTETFNAEHFAFEGDSKSLSWTSLKSRTKYFGDFSIKTDGITFDLPTASSAQSKYYGFEVTDSIGSIRDITIQFGSGSFNAAGYSLSLYGKNGVYEKTTDLYDEATQGTLVKSFGYKEKNDNEEVTFRFEDDYKAFGLVNPSMNGRSILIKSITVTWKITESFIYVPETDLTLEMDGEAHETGILVYGPATYVSSNPNVFTVDENGLVTATGGGAADLTITHDNKDYTYHIRVNEETNLLAVTSPADSQSREGWELITDVSSISDNDIIAFIAYDSKNNIYYSMDHIYGTPYQFVSPYDGITLNPETGLLEGDINKIVAIRNNPSSSVFSFIIEYIDEGERVINPIGLYPLPDISEESGFYEQLSFSESNPKWNLSIGENNYIELENCGCPGSYLAYMDGDFYIESDVEYSEEGNLPIFIYRYVGEASIPLDDTQEDGSRPALTYCHMFLNVFANICSPDGNTDRQAVIQGLDYCAASPLYNDMTMISRLMLVNAVANEDGDTIQKAMALYDYLIIRYEYADNQFLNRHPTAPSSSNKLVIDSNSAAVFAVIMIGLLSTTALMFFLKKRKHN